MPCVSFSLSFGPFGWFADGLRGSLAFPLTVCRYSATGVVRTGDNMTALYALLDESDAGIFPEVEPVVRTTDPSPFSTCMFAILPSLTTSTAELSRASAQTLILQTRRQMCLRCSLHDVILH